MGTRKLRGWFCYALLSPALLLAQRPAISPGGIVNAASLMPVDRTAHGVAPGSIASIFGQNLAPSPAKAESYPLPFQLNGTTVTVGGRVAPLFYVSPTQINFQVPSQAGAPLYGSTYSTVTVEVSTPGGRVVAPMDVYYKGFGIFTLDGSGCGRGAVLNVNADGTVSVNSPSNSAAPGSYLSFFGTGLGPVDNPPPDGAATPNDPLSAANSVPGGAGFLGTVAPGKVTFAGRAPGMAGVDQVNVLIPGNAPEGCAVPLSYDGAGFPLAFEGSTVLISIRAGGGQCVDPPSSSLGQMQLKKSVVLNDPTVPESDSFIASFSASPYQQLASPPVKSSDQLASLATAVCPTPGYSVLDAGTIAIAGPGATQAQVQLSGARGKTGYQLALSAGSVQPGTYMISSPGGGDVRAFQTSFEVPAGIQITSSFPKGTQIAHLGNHTLQPLTVNWTGGGPGQMVTLKMIEHRAGDGDDVYTVQALATSGSASFERACTFTPSTDVCALVFGGGCPDAELVVELGPDPTAFPKFSAPGLSLGGVMGWTYEYRFIGLSVP